MNTHMEKQLKVNLNDKNLDNEFRVKKAQFCANALKLILNDEIVRLEILKMPTIWRVGETSKYKEASNQEILDHIIKAREETSPEEDNELDIWVDDYYTRKSVVGYMIPMKPKIWVNTRYFDINSNKLVTSNLAHEYGHTLGFRHGGKNFRNSIPYFLNTIVNNNYDRIMMVAPEPKMKRVCRGWWIFKRCWWIEA